MHSTLVRALLDWMSFTARREMAMIYPLKCLHLWNQTSCGTEASIFTDTLSNRGRSYAACLQSYDMPVNHDLLLQKYHLTKDKNWS